MSRSAPLGAPGEARSVLAITPFRRLWISLSLSGLGEWLSLLALMSLATILTMDASPVVQYFAVSGVVVLKIAPWLLLSPFAGRVADRFDRRLTMVAADVLRGLLYLSVPVVGRLDWLLAAGLLAECAAILWTSAKDASVPGLVPRKRLEQADRIALLTAYGTAPVAAGLFALLAAFSTVLGKLFPAMAAPGADIALYINGLAFVVAAAVVWTLPLPARPAPAAGTGPEPAHAPSADDERTEEVPVPARQDDPNELTAPIGDAATLEVPAVPDEAQRKAAERAAAKERRRAAAAERRAERASSGESGDGGRNPLRTIWEGWRFAGTTPPVRGLILGMLGALAAGGAVVGVGRVFVDRLEAGNAGFGVLFGALFAGMALGMLGGPRTLRGFSRHRLFGLVLGAAGVALFFSGLIPDMVLAAVLTLVVGAGAGLAWGIGLALMGQEVEESVRGRTFAFLHAAGRLVLLGAMALAPLLAAAIGDHTLAVRGLTYDFLGAGAVLMLAAVLAVVVAVVSYRRMNGEPGEVPLTTELLAALRGVPVPAAAGAEEDEALPGTFVVLEGGEGAGKSTQAQQLAVWLREEGFEVVATREPGSTKLGMRLRALLLDKEQTGMSPRAEALLYASDRADHVHQVILPALRRGAIVISDRYVDSTLAYQGAGRELPVEEIARVNAWATGGLVPALTVLLDLPAEDGLSRLGGGTDRIESESRAFHDRVRSGFRGLAEREPDRYLVVDARGGQEQVTREIQRRLRPLLPDPVPSDAEAITGMMPVVGDQNGDDR
ncbi:dTMP kinase [Nocardiopsis baichengensis]|uniref:dTMP kinase n=1 Tax=Nocardiopsis baichengensis TaxID=280240 RepID=UPI00034C2204|nr:dTMP kinase [Nocardiopsis baichengensis]